MTRSFHSPCFITGIQPHMAKCIRLILIDLFSSISLFNFLISWLMNTRVVMMCRVGEAQSRPKREYTPKPRPSFDYGQVENSNGGYTPAATSPPYYSAGKMHLYFVCVCVCAGPPASLVCVSVNLIDHFLLLDTGGNGKQPQHKTELHPLKELPSRADPVSEIRQDAVKSHGI